MRLARYIGSGTTLFVCLMLLYNINLRQVSSLDTYASRFVPISVLRHGEITLDRFFPTLAGNPQNRYVSTYLYRTGGHLYDSHPPVGSLLSLPIYALPVWLGIPRNPETAANVLSKLSASLLTALAALFLLAAVRHVVAIAEAPPRSGGTGTVALTAVVAVFLGTSVWSTASQALWTHTPAVFGYSVALWSIVFGWPGLAGVAAGAAAVARPASAPGAMLLVAFVAHRAWSRRAVGIPVHQVMRPALTSAIALALAGGAGILYNLSVFGRIGGGAEGRTANWLDYFNTTNMLSGSLLTGVSGLTVSPSRGILVFSPVVILAGLGSIRAWRARLSDVEDASLREVWLLARYVTLAMLLTLFVYAKYLVWWGGHGFGPRYLTDVMPLAGLLIAVGLMPPGRVAPMPSLRWARSRRGTITLALCGYSIAVQAIGAFCWPSPWTLNPYVDRLWEWRDNQIVSCLRAGPRIDPVARALFERIGLLPARSDAAPE